jgi:uncharacterized protein
MSGALPELLDPLRCADSERLLAGTLPLAVLARLKGELADTAGAVVYRLHFSRDEERRAVVSGEVRARLQLVCQRCLGPVAHDLCTRFTLALVHSLDEARRLPDRYDPLLSSAAMIRPVELLEDELLLSLPQIPMHRPGECEPQAATAGREPGGDRDGASSPFAVLADWEGRPRG